MKLRNKKTGEIPDKIEIIAYIQWEKMIVMVYTNNDGERIVKQYDSLETFNEEWEDYEEPKEYWFIAHNGDVESDNDDGFDIDIECKELGNYFASRKEAERAVEKLKAWKRLKDKGFKITLRSCKGAAWLEANWGNLQGDYSDVLFLFGGKNE